MMILVQYLYDYLKSWTRSRSPSSRPVSMSILISLSLLSSLICLRVTDGRPSVVQVPSSSPTDLFIPPMSTSVTTGQGSQSLSRETETGESGDLHSEELEKQLAMEKMREGILTELGLSVELEKNRPEVNISREEYVRAYTEYMTNVRHRRSLERTQYYGARDRRRNAILRVQDFQQLTPHDVYTADILEDLTPTRRQLEFEIEMEAFENFQPRLQRAILSLPTGCFLEGDGFGKNETGTWRRSEVEVTQNVTAWFAGQSDSGNFSVPSECFKNVTERGVLKLVTRHMPSIGSVRRKRSTELSPTLVQKYQNKDSNGRSRDCDKTRHGKTCCRKSLRINFADLQVKDVVLEPKEFDAFMCVGRCNARRVPYSTTHAMFQHTLHQTRGKKFVPRPCCTPARLASLDVIHTIPGSQMLQVTILTNAVVQECGCS